MQIGILGTGRVAQALAAGWTAAGHAVTFGSRDPESKTDLSHPVADSAGTVSAAAVVVNATQGAATLDLVAQIGAAPFADKTIVDVANAVTPEFALMYPNDSLGQKLQQSLPDAKVVKTLNTVNSSLMANSAAVPASNVFMCGDDADAKATVAQLLQELGWPADSVLDLGGIASARASEHYFLMGAALLQALGTPTFNIRVVH